MANFLPSEQRTRHAFIEATVKNYLDVLDKNDAEDGYVDPYTAGHHREIVNNLFVPNIKNGRIQLGRVALQDTELIPICAASIGEKVRIPAELGIPSPSQTERIRMALARKGISTAGSNHLIDFPKDSYEQRVGPLTSALVTENPTYGKMHDGSTLYLQGRPLILLNMQTQESKNRNLTLDRTTPYVVHHELVHVAQTLEAPVHHYRTMGDIENQIIADEMQAYLHQAGIVDELKRQKYKPTEMEERLTNVDYVLLKDIRRLARSYSKRTPSGYAVTIGAPTVRTFRKLGFVPKVLSSRMNKEQRKQPISLD